MCGLEKPLPLSEKDSRVIYRLKYNLEYYSERYADVKVSFRIGLSVFFVIKWSWEALLAQTSSSKKQSNDSSRFMAFNEDLKPQQQEWKYPSENIFFILSNEHRNPRFLVGSRLAFEGQLQANRIVRNTFEKANNDIFAPNFPMCFT